MCDLNNASIGELNEKSLFIKTNVKVKKQDPCCTFRPASLPLFRLNRFWISLTNKNCNLFHSSNSE